MKSISRFRGLCDEHNEHKILITGLVCVGQLE